MKRLLLILGAATALIACNQTASVITVEPNGIGAVRIGRNISELPQQQAGIYDQILREEVEDAEMGDYTLYTFTLAADTVATVEDYERNGAITNVEVVSPKACIRDISVGTKAHDLLQNDRVKQIIDDSGYAFFVIDGCLLRINEYAPAGEAKLQKAYETGAEVHLTAEDFTDQSAVCGIICLPED